MRWDGVIVTQPASEPISVDEAKDHLNFTYTEKDDYILSRITGAREVVEQMAWRALVTQTWDFYFDRFPFGCIEVPKPPLQTITHVKYRDTDGVLQTVSSSDYNVLTAAEPGLIEPAYNTTWPTTRYQKHAVVVRAVLGYGAASAVPQLYKDAISYLVAHRFENREPIVVGTITSEVQFTLKHLLDLDHARAMIG